MIEYIAHKGGPLAIIIKEDYALSRAEFITPDTFKQ